MQIIERFSDLLAKVKPRASMDFETRSAADIKRCGAWLYSKHPTTRVLMLSFLLPGQDPADPSIWYASIAGEQIPPHYPLDPLGRPYDLERLFAWIRDGGLVEAHNVHFERCIWENIFSKPVGHDENGSTGMAAPRLRDTQLRCSAAKAAAYALPRDLGQAGAALGLAKQKDGEGKKLMLKLTKPRAIRRGEPRHDEQGEPIIYYHDYKREEIERLGAYCRDDVSAEHALSDAIPDLSEFEQKVWLADMRANWRGVYIDTELVHAAIDLDARVKAEMNERLWEITGIEKGTQRAQILTWLRQNGVTAIYDTRAPTLDWLMRHPTFPALPEDVQTVVEIARNINRSSTTKYKRILQCLDPDDGRVRELVMYHGAATGRWAGKGIQVQNFPKGDLDGLALGKRPDGSNRFNGVVKMEFAVWAVKTRDLEFCRAVFGDVLGLLSSVTRGALVPGPGKIFYVADYSAIEARVVLWLANDDAALEVFRTGGDIYCHMASGLYGRKITKADKAERQFGKVAVLGLGYGMGYMTFLFTLRTYNIAFDEATAVSIMGAQATTYLDWVRNNLWPAQPDNMQDAKAVRRWKNAKKQAALNLRRLREAREDPESVVAELALCKYTVDTYRHQYGSVRELWRAQEDAAVKAVLEWKAEQRRAQDAFGDYLEGRCGEDALVLQPKPVQCGRVTWVVDDRYLFCILPSGRRLVYTDPSVVWNATPWGERVSQLRFMGVHKISKKWTRMATYGGSIVENIDQATARDLMANALVTLDESEEYSPIASIHDELLSEADDDYTPPTEDRHQEYERMMVQLPDWADGCPVGAEADVLGRYQK